MSTDSSALQPGLTTWCRTCGGRIIVPPKAKRPAYCRLACRVGHFRRRWRL